jgi:hypothetical protein
MNTGARMIPLTPAVNQRAALHTLLLCVSGAKS